jgi:hypothetical protein
MHADQDYRQLLFKLAVAGQTPRRRLLKFRETLDTAILGTMSTSIGIAALIVVAWCIATGHKFEGRVGSLPTILAVGIVVIVGEGLGVAGLTLGRIRDGIIPPLSAIGTIVCLTYLFCGQFVIPVQLL